MSRAGLIERRVARAAGALGATMLAIGALHLPFARGLLMRAGGCPLAGAKMTPELMDSARRMSLATSARVEPGAVEQAAPSRPALGFALDETTVPDVHAWAASAKVACEDAREGLVTCVDVPPRALGRADAERPVDELTLAFDARGRLVNVTTLRSHLSPSVAARAAQDMLARLMERLGAAAEAGADFTPARLATPGVSSLTTRSYRFRDYVASVAAMNVPATGLAVREHYMSGSASD